MKHPRIDSLFVGEFKVGNILRNGWTVIRWRRTAYRMNLGDDADQSAFAAMLERLADAMRSKNPASYLAGIASHAIRRVVQQQWRERDLAPWSLDMPTRCQTTDMQTVGDCIEDPRSPLPSYKSTGDLPDDPFELVPEDSRQLVRDHFTNTPTSHTSRYYREVNRGIHKAKVNADRMLQRAR